VSSAAPVEWFMPLLREQSTAVAPPPRPKTPLRGASPWVIKSDLMAGVSAEHRWPTYVTFDAATLRNALSATVVCHVEALGVVVDTTGHSGDDLCTDAQIDATLEELTQVSSTRIAARNIVMTLRSLGLDLRRVLPGADGGVALYVTDRSRRGYASIDIYDDGDITIGVSTDHGIEMVDTSCELVIALSDVARLLRR